MSKNDSVVAIFHGNEKAWQAVRKIQQSGFDIHNLTVVGNSAPAGLDKTRDYNAGDWIKKWGFPSDATLYSISDIGPIAIEGPLVTAIAEGQEAGEVEAEFSALGAGLWRCGIPRDNVPQYETAVKSNNYLVIVHCTPDEVIRVKEIFEPLQVVDIAVHHA
jgi:hypothetical protein